ncbi:MAG: DUF4301 family protein [Bacteroidota bacterium]
MYKSGKKYGIEMDENLWNLPVDKIYMDLHQPDSVFSERDLEQIHQSGKRVEDVLAQLSIFSMGFPDVTLLREVSPEDGVLTCSQQNQQLYLDKFELARERVRMAKFVPASGASSRMFKLLYAYLQNPEDFSEDEHTQISTFCQQLEAYAFYQPLEEALETSGYKLKELQEKESYKVIISHLITEKGLAFGSLPKALIPFHSYKEGCRTAIEEHLVEAANYCVSADKMVKLHITLSPQHIPLVKDLMKKVLPIYEKKLGVKYDIAYSIQNPATDTLAVDLENQPYYLEDGSLLFRPGGHGALLENLQQMESDWVYIKNIDNVVHDDWKESTYLWKKILGGVMYSFQEKIFDWLRQLEDTHLILPEVERNLQAFLKGEVGLGFPDYFGEWGREERVSWYRKKLNRPIRVCGIIRTAEATGGGPFWVAQEGEASLQIIETAQINLADPAQQEILSRSRYAHITDLVCGLKDVKGQKFDLPAYRNDQMGFIVQKSLNGRPLRAMELPGLWNGAMADWNTILLEVPHETFNPVKTVMDLAGKEHRPK